MHTLHTTYYLTLHISLRVFKFLMECYCGGTLGHPVRKCVYDRLFRCRICRRCRSFAGQSGVPVQNTGRGSEKKFFLSAGGTWGRKPVLKRPASRTVKAHSGGAHPWYLLMLHQNRWNASRLRSWQSWFRRKFSRSLHDSRGDELCLVSILPLPPRSRPLFKIMHEAVSKAIRDDGIRGIGTTPKKSYDSYLRRHQTIRRCSAHQFCLLVSRASKQTILAREIVRDPPPYWCGNRTVLSPAKPRSCRRLLNSLDQVLVVRAETCTLKRSDAPPYLLALLWYRS